MSAAATADAPAPAKGKKKLIIIIAVVALVLVGGGVAAMMMMKNKAGADAEADADGGQAPAKTAVSKMDPKAMPTFVPLDPFTVNLADRDAERFAQVGITLEVTDPKLADTIKNFMPAIRHNLLLTIADRTAADLMGRDGKTRLAEKIKRETARALGYEVPEEEAEVAADEKAEKSEKSDKGEKKPSKKQKKAAETELPVKAVHFSNFIIQ